MKVLLPASSPSSRPSGVSRHAANLARCLLRNAEVDRVDLIVGEWQHEAMLSMLNVVDKRLSVSVVRVGSSALARNIWYWSALPRLAENLHSYIVHVTYSVPVRRSAFNCPVVVTLHDLYPCDVPANFDYPKVLVNRAILQQCLRAVDSIACVSESTLHRLEIHATSAVLQKAVTIYNCVNPSEPVAVKCPLEGWQGEPFLLCVAQHRRNKNIVLAMQVSQRLLECGDLPHTACLLIVGANGPETPSIENFIHDSGLATSISMLSGFSDAELEWCYGQCELLLAPSTVEGFGLPVVEAMLHHCRVVCSDIPAFREVGGSYCQYASLQQDPVQGFVDATRAALASHKFRTAVTDTFSESRIAEAYRRLYHRLLQADASRRVIAACKQAASFERGRP